MPSFRYIARRAAATLLSLAVIASAGGAQDTLAVGDRVRLRLVAPRSDLYSRTRFEGPVLRVTGDSVALRDRLRTRAFALADVRSVERRMRVRSAGGGALRYGIGSALVGAAAGALAGAKVGGPGQCTTEPGGQCFDQDLLPTRATAVAIGAAAGLLGAWYGATAGRWQWVPLPPSSAR